MDMFAGDRDFQADLFGGPRLPGLRQAPAFITEAEEAELIAGIDATDLSPFRFQQWTGKRLTQSFGWSYDFETGRFAPAAPVPDWLDSIRTRAEQFADLARGELVQALLIRYDPGAGIGWHRDRPVFEHVVGLSLGEPATMRFRRRLGDEFERASASLAPRGIYHMSGEIRHEWEHSITDMAATRWSITFRSLSEKARSLA